MTAWSLGFALLRRVRPAWPARWQASGGQRALVIAPHPDDESMGCAGVILQHVQAGDLVCLLIVTDGGRSRALGLNQTDIVRWRRAEALAAAALLGVEQILCLGLPEGEWTAEQLVAHLQPLLSHFAPDFIYAPSLVDFHPEHIRVAQIVSGLLPPQATVRVYQVQVPLTATLTNLVVDVSEWSEQITAVLNVYQTQQGSLANAWRQRRYAAQRYTAQRYVAHFYGLGRQVEEFWQMSGAHYTRLHKLAPVQWPMATFRGLRYRAFSDPLAYVQGRLARRRLVQALDDPSLHGPPFHSAAIP
jgi:LmbE family N-acetylglucosaminyl deacetylase